MHTRGSPSSRHGPDARPSSAAFISKGHIRTLHHVKAIACSECFHDQGLRLDAQRLGVTDSTACPNCGATIGRKLNSDRLAAPASQFFVWGSLLRCEYGAAPQIQITVPSWLEADMRLIERSNSKMKPSRSCPLKIAEVATSLLSLRQEYNRDRALGGKRRHQGSPRKDRLLL